MATIKELEQARALIKSEGKALLKTIKTKEDNSEDAAPELTELQKLKAKLDDVNTEVESLLKAEFADTEDDDGEKDEDEGDDNGEKAFSAPIKKDFNMTTKKFNINTLKHPVEYQAKGEELGRQALTQHMVRKYGPQTGHEYAKTHFNDEKMMDKLVVKSGYVGPNTVAGSGVQPADYSSEVIELMYAKNVLLPLLNVEQLPYGNKGWFRHRQGVTPSFVAEGSFLPVTQNAWDIVPISWKKYGAKTYVTKEMVEFTPLKVVNTIIDNLTTEMGLWKEYNLLFGTGGSVFTGLLSALASSQIFYSSATQNGPEYGTLSITQQIANDLEQSTLKLTQNLVDLDGIVHMTSFGVTSFLRQFRTGLGYSENIAFPSINENNTWNGRKILESNLIPASTPPYQLSANFTVTGSLTVSPFITVNPKYIRMAEAIDSFRIDTTDVGGLTDGSTQVNTWDSDLIAFKAVGYAESMLEHDCVGSVLLTQGWSLNNIAALYYYSQAANTATVPVSGVPGGQF
jgi:HK97 family phage major capsid protein